ncbi:MAG: hypothetical protein ACK5OX_17925, partial [Desertimonas sp.]
MLTRFRPTGRRTTIVISTMMAFGIAGCADEPLVLTYDGPPPTFEDVRVLLPPSTTVGAPATASSAVPTTPVAETTPPAPTAAWAPATGNLEGLESECG